MWSGVLLCGFHIQGLLPLASLHPQLWHRKETPALPQRVYGKEELNRVFLEYKSINMGSDREEWSHFMGVYRDGAYWEPSAVIILS